MTTITTGGSATLWNPLEVSARGPEGGRPFRDVDVTVTFAHEGREVVAKGFYDGPATWRARLLPDAEGEWTWTMQSSAAELDGQSGRFHVGPAETGHHGPVRVDGMHFRHADGTRYLNIGTTAYVWNLQGDAAEEQTLATLAEAPFTKIRMCVFPKHYRYNQNEPDRYPFAVTRQGESRWPASIDESGWQFDFDAIEPDYFRHLETRICQLAKIGVQADLILLHPYDRWGFSRMSAEQDDRYLTYVVSRLAALPNVWWSMANEYDFMLNKSPEDWSRMIGVVADTDPHGHLLSVHNCFAPYDYSDPRITHVSIQRQNTGDAAAWRKRWGKPVSDDECSYEGDIEEAWGNIGPREMVHRFWAGTAAGAYVTHGETYYNDTETLWWAKGGTLTGDSVPRIAFLRSILEEAPDGGLDPLPGTAAHTLSVVGFDNATLADLTTPQPGQEDWPRAGTMFPVAGVEGQWYLTYFGPNQPREAQAVLPPDQSYSVDVVDTWEMSRSQVATGVQRGDKLFFSAKPYQALIYKREV